MNENVIPLLRAPGEQPVEPPREVKPGYGNCESCHRLCWIAEAREIDPVTTLLFGTCSPCVKLRDEAAS